MRRLPVASRRGVCQTRLCPTPSGDAWAEARAQEEMDGWSLGEKSVHEIEGRVLIGPMKPSLVKSEHFSDG